VGIASATNSAVSSELGVQIECTVTDFLSKERQVELSIILFHPIGSRFTNQTTSIKRGSSIFFSGALSLIENQLYLELQNFSFVTKNNQSLTEKPLPWSRSPQTPNNPISFAAQVHNFNKKLNTDSQQNAQSNNVFNKKSPTVETFDQKSEDDPITQTSEKSNNTTPKPVGRTRKNLPIPTPTSTKRKTRSSNRTSNKKQKLADIASNIIAVGDSDEELEAE
jgi:hypothetical protein